MIFYQLIIFLGSIGIVISAGTLCTEKFCEDYLKEKKISCPELPSNCTVGKPGFNGYEALFPMSPCNCCPYCLTYLGLGDDCPIGEATSVIPASMCGPGLYCVQDPKTKLKKCQKMVDIVNDIPADNSDLYLKCLQEQKRYDDNLASGIEGNLQIRPNCDGNGYYASYKCIPGEICYCVDEYGERIFGEIPFTTLTEQLLTCGCSRHNARLQKQLQSSANTWSQMRCLSDGSFDPIQCLEDGCLCVDKNDGTPTYPDMPLINSSAISHNSLPCFDNKTHMEYDYLQICEDIFNRNYEDDVRYITEDLDLYGSIFANCQMNGKYAAVQHNEKEKYCADSEGNKMKDYVLPITNPQVNYMNCKCARANLLISNVEKSTCCSNGNYNRMQCRRGECRCVDDNGNQITKQVPFENREKLYCYFHQCTPDAFN